MGWLVIPQGLFYQLEGASIIAADDEFLGLVSRNPIAPNSISNPIGAYGSVISGLSILNVIGAYGSVISDYSPFNVIANNPPGIFIDDEFVAHLTANVLLTPRVDPKELLGWLGIQHS